MRRCISIVARNGPDSQWTGHQVGWGQFVDPYADGEGYLKYNDPTKTQYITDVIGKFEVIDDKIYIYQIVNNTKIDDITSDAPFVLVSIIEGNTISYVDVGSGGIQFGNTFNMKWDSFLPEHDSYVIGSSDHRISEIHVVDLNVRNLHVTTSYDLP